ncbi:MAG: aminoglycoside phosphotransferase family protein [Solirubrobacterales bacterium]|nr:aminoglycoside phosphotransferase family protein [Solirubrobacterales bacterium]
MASGESDTRWVGLVLEQVVAEATPAAWGFQNQTDIVTLGSGDRVVLQRYRRPEDAEYRLEVMGALRNSAAAAGIAISKVRAFDLDAHPAWIIFDALPGVPVPEVDGGLEGPRFPALAHAMGEMLAAFRELPIDGLEVDRSWADPARLAARAEEWAAARQGLDDPERATLAGELALVRKLFRGRPVVLAHGDFSPVNILSDGRALTGLVDFESVRLADPLFDVAWWEWSVSFSSPAVLEAAWPEFLDGAGIDANEPDLFRRIRSLQLLRMLELLAGDSLGPGVRRTVAERLHTLLRRQAP